MSRSRSRRRRRSGFTLMEVLLVLAILVILGSLATMSFTGVFSSAEEKGVKGQIGAFKTPIDLYQMTFRKYPTSLQDLVVAPADVDQAKWQKEIGPSIPGGSIPKDAWGNDYQFAAPGTHNPNGYDIWSNGPDGAPNTADDIGNWEQPK
jgi:general secretion pathway protein G